MANNPTLPLTGTGDATAKVAAEDVSGVYYQYLKLTDGSSGSTQGVPATNAAPTTGMYGLVVRNLPSGVQSVSPASTGTWGGVQVLNPTTAVTVNGTVGISSSTGQIGSVSLLAGSSANTLGNVTVSNLSTGGGGSTVVDANLTTAGGGGLIGLVDGLRFTAAARSSANSSADVSLLAANAARRGAIIQNASTGTALLVNLSTVAVSSASPYNFQVPANGYVTIGGQTGNFPLYTGAIRGKMNSTAVAGPVFLTEFTS